MAHVSSRESRDERRYGCQRDPGTTTRVLPTSAWSTDDGVARDADRRHRSALR
jgi:hypothetical protein